MTRTLAELQTLIGYRFKDEKLLKAALTHSSVAEQENYERLEFLGDRVLGLVVSDFLFRQFPHEAEGDLAKRLAALVQGSTLAALSARLSLGDFIAFSVAEREAGGASNEHILADVFEALIGALYVDGGFEICRRLIEAQWDEALFTMKSPPQHPKTEVQEWAQGQGLPLPLYEIAEQSGPDHAPLFKISMTVKGYKPVMGQGRSRAEAEKNAARLFLKNQKDKI